MTEAAYAIQLVYGWIILFLQIAFFICTITMLIVHNKKIKKLENDNIKNQDKIEILSAEIKKAEKE